MQPIDYKMPADGTLRITSDWQVGSVTWADDLVDELLEPVLTRRDHRLVCVGDMVDAITVKDKRFSWQDLDPRFATPQQQRHEVVRRLKKVAQKGRLLGIGMGNHEAARDEDGDPTVDMASALKTAYLGYQAIVRVNGAAQLLLWHGRRSIGSTATDPFHRKLAIKRALVRTNLGKWGRTKCDLIAQGHVNQLEVVRPDDSMELSMGYNWDNHSLEAEYVNMDPRWYAVCGSLQRAYVVGKSTYVERHGFHPLPLGCVDVEFERSRIKDVRIVRLG